MRGCGIRGARYHSYTLDGAHLILAPEARDGEAIHRPLIECLTRVHHDLQPAAR
jgi:hypothetical protein